MNTLRIASLCSLVLVAAACGNGGGTSGQCIAAGGICTISATCCSRNCDTKTGKCVGGDVVNPDMAMSMQPNPDLAMNAGCQPLNGACAKPADCCQGLTCTNNTCVTQANLKQFGETCTADKDCASALCVGVNGVNGRFCSAGCARSSDCTALSNNPPYWCVQGNGGNFCLRDCTTSAECKDIGTSWSCDVVKSIDGLIKGMCGVYQNLAPGLPCIENSQCAGNACNTYWCANTCASDAACGQYARCITNGGGANTCFPNCAADADCAVFGQDFTCQQTTSLSGATVKICSL